MCYDNVDKQNRSRGLQDRQRRNLIRFVCGTTQNLDVASRTVVLCTSVLPARTLGTPGRTARCSRRKKPNRLVKLKIHPRRTGEVQ